MTSSNYKEEINFLSQDPVEDIKIEEDVKEAEVFDHYELHDALLWLDDILGRGLIRWVLVGDIAEQIYRQDNPTLIGNKIEAVILREQLTESGRNMVSSWIPQIKDDNLLELEITYEGVPVHIKIVDEDPGYYKNPDRKFYYISDIYLPNPFEDYLNDRNN